MAGRKSDAFNGNGFSHAVGIDTGVVQHDDAAERMSDKADRELINDIEQRREIEYMFRDAIHGAGSPGAVAVSAQVQSVDVIMLTQGARHPVPVARVVKAAVDEHQRGLAVLAVIPELELQPVRIKEVRNWFHFGG